LGLFLVKKETNKFLIANIFSFLTIIPYLLTIYKKSLNPSFNAWLEKPSLLLIDSHIVFYFGNIVFFVITIVLLIILLKKYLYQKKEYYFFLYFFYVIGFVFLFAFLVSLILKPILFERYFTIFIPLAMVLFAIILSLDFGKNTIVIIFAIFLFALNIPKYENFNLFSNIYQTVKFSTVDYKNQNSQYDVFFVVPDMIDYVNYFKEDFKDINREQILVSNFGSREDKDLIEEYKRMSKKKSNVIFYVPEICVNSKIKYEKNLTVKKISTTIVPIYKITLD